MDEPDRQQDSNGEVISPGELEGSSRGRKHFSSIVKPLQIEKTDNIDGTTAAAAAAPDPNPEAGTGEYQFVSEEGREGRDREEREGGHNHGRRDSRRMSAGQQPLSAAAENMIASRIEELSQLDSPILRELASRLGERFNVQTPAAKRNRSSKVGKESAPHPYSKFIIGSRWQEIQGSNSWKGLLDPIDPVLRAEIVRYGEFAEACYDSFDAELESKYCGSCKHTKEELLDKAGLENRGYEVTDYLYATADLDIPNFFTKSVSEDSWSKNSNWMGFVAVTTSPEEIIRLGRRDILIAWRGTVTKFEWIKDVQDFSSPVGFDPRHEHAEVRVEKGFLSVYTSVNENSRYNKTSVREQVLGAVKRLVEKYQHEGNLSITVTGHSLGSALAMLCAYDIAQSCMNPLSAPTPTVPHKWGTQTVGWRDPLEGNPDSNSQKAQVQNLQVDSRDAGRDDSDSDEDDKGGSGRLSGSGALADKSDGSKNRFSSDRIPITVFSLAGPRVGNAAFKKHVEELGVAILRVVNKHDLVTKVPGAVGKLLEIIEPILPGLPTYRHVGEVLRIDHLMSPFLQPKTSPTCSHTLEGYLHVLDGFHGTNMPFYRTVRDFALVNKRANFLKGEYFIPGHWWQDENKGLRRDKDGHWIVPKRDDEIFPKSRAPLADVQVVKDGNGLPRGSFWRNVSLAISRKELL